MDDRTTFSWLAFEHDEKEHSTDWYWGFGAMVLALALVSIFFNNVLLALIFLLGGFSYMTYTARKPEEVTVTISSRGVHMGGTIYPFGEISAYSFDLEPPRRRLVLISSRAIVSHTYIPIDADEDIASIRAHLDPFVDEVPYLPTLADRITEYL